SMIDRDTANKLDNIFNGKQASQPNNSGKNTANNNQHTRNKSNTATNIQNKTQSNNSDNAVKRSNDKTDKKANPRNEMRQNKPNNKQQKDNWRNKNNNSNKKSNNNNSKQRQKPQQHQPAPPKQKELPEKIIFSGSLTVGELAKKIHREPSEIIKKLFMLGVIATINQDLDKDAIELICSEYGVEVEEEIQIDTTDLEVYFNDDNE